MKKCSNCKVDNPDEAKFCRKCGKSLGKAPSPFIKKLKDKRVIFTSTALAIAISGGVGFALYENTPERRYQKNLAMGEKYLNEYNFEKAEEYLNVAKSIDPKKEEAYQGLVKVYKAQGETAKADTVISQAKQTLPSAQQSSFLDQLESLTEKANQIAQESLEAQRVAKNNSSQAASTEKTSTQNNASPNNTNNALSTQPSSQEISSDTASPKDEVVAIAERPIVDPQDLSHLDEIAGQATTISTSQPNQKSDSVASEKDSDQKSSDVIAPPKKREMTDTEKNDPQPSITAETQIIFVPNTPYIPIAEIGSLDMAPIALNSDCWIIKKGNEFQFLFPDGNTQKLESKDQLVLQVNPTGNTTLLSSACLVDSSNKKSNQYYPKEEEVSSCLLSNNENSYYSLEGNYQNSTVPVLVRSSNQSGYWIYNPATQVLYGPFKDSEDTSFYSKISRLSDTTLVGHNGQLGGPYWTPAHAPIQESIKNGKIPALSSSTKDDSELISKESKSVEDSKNSSEASLEKMTTEELQIWSKDGKSYKTGYTNPKIIDWYSLGAFQDKQFHLLNENLEIVYAGPFEQGGSVINGVAPVQINGNWKLVQFENVPSSGPTTNYSFTNTIKEKNESDISSDQTKKSSDEKNSSDTTRNSSTTKDGDKKSSSSETTQSNKNSSVEKDDEKSEDSSTQSHNNYFLKDADESSTDKTELENSTSSSEKSSSQKSTNYFLKDEDSEVTSTGKSDSNVIKEKDKIEAEDSATKSSDKAVTSGQEKANYFEKDKESSEDSSSSTEKKTNTKEDVNYFDKSSESTDNKSKTVTTNDKDKKSVTVSDKSSTKESTSDTKKSSTTTSNDKASTSNSKTKDEDTTGSGLSKKEDTSVEKDNEDSDKTAEPIYYSFPEFAGTYTVTGEDWSNSFKLYKDGSFEGEYTEVSEGDDPELYPNGVIRICSYSGTFSLKNDRLKITSLSLEKVPGKVEEEGIVYEYLGLSDSCMSKGDMFTLYGPGTPYSAFSTKALRWIPTPTTSATVDFIMVQDGTSEFAYV